MEEEVKHRLNRLLMQYTIIILYYANFDVGAPPETSIFPSAPAAPTWLSVPCDLLLTSIPLTTGASVLTGALLNAASASSVVW